MVSLALPQSPIDTKFSQTVNPHGFYSANASLETGDFHHYIKKNLLRLIIGLVPEKDLGIPSGAHS
jgi:hypothetical protein